MLYQEFASRLASHLGAPHLTSGTSFGPDLPDVHHLMSSSILTSIFSFLSDRCSQLFVEARGFLFDLCFFVPTALPNALQLFLRTQRFLFLWIFLVGWLNWAPSGSAASIFWLLFFLCRDESLDRCCTSGLLP